MECGVFSAAFAKGFSPTIPACYGGFPSMDTWRPFRAKALEEERR